MTPKALPSGEKEDGRSPWQLLVRGVKLAVGLVDALDFVVAAVLTVLIIVALWLDQWNASPVLAVLVLLAGSRAVLRAIRRAREERRRGIEEAPHQGLLSNKEDE